MPRDRYHLQLKKHRATVYLDNIVSDLISMKLGVKPGTAQAYHAIKKQLELYMELGLGMEWRALNEFIVEDAILELVDSGLSEKYMNYICTGH